jgi:hypothetical protein
MDIQELLDLYIIIIITISLLMPTAGAQAAFRDYPQGERAINHHAGLVQIGGC